MPKAKAPGLPLSPDFYAREPDVVARALIGKRLVRVLGDVTLIGRIVETEGYRGSEDAASHAASWAPQPATPPCLGHQGTPTSTSSMACTGCSISRHTPTRSPRSSAHPRLSSLTGIETMQHNRGGNFAPGDPRLTNGPARLAQAFAIEGTLNGSDLCGTGPLSIVEGSLLPWEQIASGPRVRVPGDADARSRPWRFWIASNRYTSS